MQATNLHAEEGSSDCLSGGGTLPELPAAPDAHWIWPDDQMEENQYVQFQQDFLLGEVPAASELRIGADSIFALWLNGQFVESQQSREFPTAKTFFRIDVAPFLKSGANRLCCLIYYQGRETTSYSKGVPGLIFQLKVNGRAVAESGSETFWRRDRSYRQGSMPLITGNISHMFEYDARQSDDWLCESFRRGTDWAPIHDLPLHGAGILRERAVEKLALSRRIGATMLAQGVFRRDPALGANVAEIMQADFLSAWTPAQFIKTENELESFRGSFYSLDIRLPQENGIAFRDLPPGLDGYYILLDLGGEEAGLLELDLDAPAGTHIDISYGEHLNDLRVRASVQGRHFASRYICREGRQQFTHYFTRWAGRYIQLHISGGPANIVFYYAGLRKVSYPLTPNGNFASSDRLFNKIYEVSSHTLDLCMHEFFEDCPWREQTLYVNDSRNQALSSYYRFGDCRYAAASWRHYETTLTEEGFLQNSPPGGKIGPVIPSFSLMWVPALADHLKFSGDTAFASAMLPVVNRMLEIQIETMSGGLLPCPRGEKYWHFYEWTPHLSGLKSLQRHREVLTGVRYDAMLNAIFCMALEAGAGLNTSCQQPDVAGKYRDIASGLRGAFHDRFWMSEAAAYANSIGQDVQPTFSGLTQAMAICAHLCPDGMQASLISRLASNDRALSPVSLSQTLYKYEAILSLRDAHSKGVFEEIAKIWGEMLFRGATTFWETSNGPTELMGVGSLCHGWSAIPIYFFQAWLLGIKPLEPGFASFSVEPLPGAVHSVSGTVPTPHGPIHLSWNLLGTSVDLEITVPPRTVATMPDGRMLDAGFHRVSLPAPSACKSSIQQHPLPANELI
jgi:hypothetical protein